MPIRQAIVYDAVRKLWSAPDYPFWDFVNQSMGDAFLKQMRTIAPEHVLEYYVDTNVEKTAGQIYRESVTVARQLKQLGVRKGDVVLLYSMNNVWTTPLLFGCFLIGAIVNCFETKLSTAHLDATLQLLAPIMILYEETYAQDLAASLQRSPLPTLKYRISIDGAQAPNAASVLLQPVASDEQLANFQAIQIGNPQLETAVYVLTSGSTGPPKAVDLSHALLLHGVITWYCHTDTAPLDADMVVFSFSPLRWISQLDMLLTAVLCGAKRICAAGFPEGAYGRDIIRKTGITHFFAPPSVFQDILEAVPAGDTQVLSSLRCIQLGGEPPLQSVRNLAKKLVPQGRVYCCYGMTELGGVIANDQVANGGKLVSGLQLQILDDEMQPLGPGVRGQLYIKLVVPYKGYLKIDNSQYYSADGYFLNGDYGYVDKDNNLHVEGRHKELVRAKDVILIPNNVEYILNELPEISMARLVGYRKSANSNDDTGALFILLKPNLQLTEDAVRQKVHDTLKARLNAPEYANIVDFHIVQKLPITSCGKVDRVALRNQASVM